MAILYKSVLIDMTGEHHNSMVVITRDLEPYNVSALGFPRYSSDLHLCNDQYAEGYALFKRSLTLQSIFIS